jgi:hypothetical protein
MAKEAPAPDWKGRTVVCLASGPSLTQADVDLVRLSGHPTVVTNTTFRMAPWADMLFGFDARWWATKDPATGLTHAQESARDFAGRRITKSQLGTTYGISGTCAIAMAVHGGAARIILLGFDSTFGPKGERHWHGNHPGGLGNCASIARWPGHFKRTKRMADAAGVRILNCSRRTALDCFERVPLEQALALDLETAE